MIHSAIARATPPAWVIHTASATQKPFKPDHSPINGKLSTVKENKPFIASTISLLANEGITSVADSMAPFQSSGVNDIWLGITSASSQGTISTALTGSGLCPYQPTARLCL